MNKQTNTSLKQVIVRISPVSHSPILFDVESKNDNQITCIVNGEDKVVDLGFYAASIPMEDTEARAVVQAYAERANIPLESLLLRHRLPKDMSKSKKQPRKMNDSNLVLVSKSKDAQQDYRSKSELEAAVQSMQDDHNKDKASASNPEGAVVKRTETEQKPRRKYERTPKELRNKRSASALKRYHAELQATEKETTVAPAPMQLVVSNMDEDSLREQKLLTAMKLIKEIGSEVKPSLVKAIMDLL